MMNVVVSIQSTFIIIYNIHKGCAFTVPSQITCCYQIIVCYFKEDTTFTPKDLFSSNLLPKYGLCIKYFILYLCKLFHLL